MNTSGAIPRSTESNQMNSNVNAFGNHSEGLRYELLYESIVTHMVISCVSAVSNGASNVAAVMRIILINMLNPI